MVTTATAAHPLSRTTPTVPTCAIGTFRTVESAVETLCAPSPCSRSPEENTGNDQHGTDRPRPVAGRVLPWLVDVVLWSVRSCQSQHETNERDGTRNYPR